MRSSTVAFVTAGMIVSGILVLAGVQSAQTAGTSPANLVPMSPIDPSARWKKEHPDDSKLLTVLNLKNSHIYICGDVSGTCVGIEVP